MFFSRQTLNKVFWLYIVRPPLGSLHCRNLSLLIKCPPCPFFGPFLIIHLSSWFTARIGRPGSLGCPSARWVKPENLYSFRKPAYFSWSLSHLKNTGAFWKMLVVSLTRQISTSSQGICQACCLTRTLCYEHLSICVRVQTLFSDHSNLFMITRKERV